MDTQTAIQQYEQKLIGIVRRLPPERVSELIDFAQFLAFQARVHGEESPDESEEEIVADNARWDALFATDESQRLLEKMADEALAEIEAGHAKSMAFTDDGEIVPE